jgi:DNA uptake protein ComE-like DNA-binding protein
MTSQIYKRIEGFLVLPEIPATRKMAIDFGAADTKRAAGFVERDTLIPNRYPGKKQFSIVALNEADSAQLEGLPGIGPVLAARIIKYRKLLGGFYEVAQLREIYGMTEELWIKCSPWLLADSTGMKKLPINYLSVSELGRHPYIGFSHAKKIVKQRDSYGKLNGKEDLANCFSPDSLDRLLPYLSLGGM